MSTLSFRFVQDDLTSCPGSESKRDVATCSQRCLFNFVGNTQYIAFYAFVTTICHVSIELRAPKPVHAPARVTPTTVQRIAELSCEKAFRGKRNTR